MTCAWWPWSSTVRFSTGSTGSAPGSRRGMCWRWSPSLAVAVPPRVRTHHQKRTTRGWQNGRRGRSGRSGFQDAASPSAGKRASRFCGACDTTSCCNGLVSCGSDGRNAKRDALLGQHLTDFVPVIPLIPHHRGRRRQVIEHHISTGEVTALPLTQVESQGTTFAVTDPMELAGHAPLGATNQAGGHPLVGAGRRGMGFDVSGVNHQDLWLCGIGC